MRKLASIQRIIEVKNVENSDTLAVVSVLGWKVVVRRDDNYSVGDLVIYFELDSILPRIPEFAFMEKSDYILRTMRLRGQLSQGLVWKTNILPSDLEIVEGFDLTDILGVEKYEEEISEEMIGKSKLSSKD
jgi:RNA ligase (TIGR02306 family)